MCHKPKVSIIIPAYNASNYLAEAIDSALSQTYDNIEVLVINDGSKDDGATKKIAQSYGDKIKYFEKENGGVSSALNLGIRKMSGEYFSWLSHDDVYEVDKIEKQVEVLNKVNKKTLIYGKNRLIDEHSNFINSFKHNFDFETNKLISSKDVLSILLNKGTLNGCCLLIPKEVLIDNGMFEEKLRFCQDAFLWYKLFINGYSLYCIDDVIVRNRIHSNQVTQTHQKLFIKECNKISDFLTEKFVNISTAENNFLKMYLLSDAKYFYIDKLNKNITKGLNHKLLSLLTIIRIYILWMYGKIRPYIRKVYYGVFRRIKIK